MQAGCGGWQAFIRRVSQPEASTLSSNAPHQAGSGQLLDLVVPRGSSCAKRSLSRHILRSYQHLSPSRGSAEQKRELVALRG